MSNRRDDLIQKYAADIKSKFGQTPDMDLLTKVTIGLGPAIYNMDSSKVSGTDDADTYGVSERNKHRAVVYYILAKHFKKESVYN